MSKRAVFLDRDGTIIEDIGFVRRVEDVKLLPQAAEAVARLNQAGWAVVVVTNQSGVARGLLTEKDVAATNARMTDLLAKHGARVDAIYYCPHLPEGKVQEFSIVCGCRKPRPGMILKAAQDLDIDLTKSVMLGDSPRDVEAGLAAGTQAILLTQSASRAEQAPDACGQAPNIVAAVDEILQISSAPEANPEPASAPDPVVALAPAEKPPVAKIQNPKSRIENPPEPLPEIPVRPTPKEFIPDAEPAPRAKAKPAESSAGNPKPKTQNPKSDPPAEKVEPEEKPAPSAASKSKIENPKSAVPAAEGASPCSRCGQIVHPSDVEAGRAFNKDGVCLCGTCVAALRVARTQGKEVGNEELLREMQNVTRALTYERFTFWHVLGCVTQAMAFGILILTLTRVTNFAAPEGLLWAIFQLLTLTFFILGRR